MEAIADFHFIRPLWLLAILPILWTGWKLWQRQGRATGLETCIDPSLLSVLVAGKNRQPSRLPVIGLMILWLLAVTALAGPTWERRPQPVFQSQATVIIALDLSPGMAAEDVKPSRIVRAHLKIQDFLSARKEGLTGLIVYSGEAFVVTPLTDDTRTIGNLLNTLTPGILPIPGSNVEMAVELASELARSSGISKASLLLVSDDIDPAAISTLTQSFPGNLQLTILGIGTDEGAPVPVNGDFLKDTNGNIVIARRNSAGMKQLAAANDGFYLPMQLDNSDIDFYLRHLDRLFSNHRLSSHWQQQEDSRSSDEWYEFGPTLLLLMLPFAALLFRRGWLPGTVFVTVTLGTATPQMAQASLWQSLWKNNNQRAYEAYRQQQFNRAGEKFNDPLWKGIARYRQGDYQDAIKSFQQNDSAVSHYNRGNALANLQQFGEAIAAYDQALALNPDLTQAKNNRQRIEELLKQQQQKQQQQQQQNQQQGEAGDNTSDNNRSNQKPPDNNDAGSDNQSNQNGNHPQENNAEESEAGSREDKNTESGAGQSPQSPSDTLSREQENDNQAASRDDQQGLTEQREEKNDGDDNESRALVNPADSLSAEEQQALQQWLQKVPDDPGGLLQRKFQYEFEKRKQLYRQGQWQLPENDAHKRY